MKKLKPLYAGEQSAAFWDRVNAIKPKQLRDAIYLAACALQDHERRVLQMLHTAEAKK